MFGAFWLEATTDWMAVVWAEAADFKAIYLSRFSTAMSSREADLPFPDFRIFFDIS